MVENTRMIEDNTTPAPTRLGKLKPRDTSYAAADTISYSRKVGRLRWILPATALIAVALLFIWPYWQTNRIAVTMVDNVPNLMIEKLNLSGLDAKNQPYNLTADRALQAQDKRDLVDLENPKGEINLQNGAWVAGQAERGQLNESDKKLWLGGNVELFHDDGYRFSSNELYFDMDKSNAWGDKPVTIQGNFGEIEGEGFQMTNGGDSLVVKGPARAKLYLHPEPTEGKPNINHSSSR
ncbi:MAG: LPS export ABC transporter periplasmic protein LptC [Proteobacteria bacterium]|jgi:lipopolysaccharide export system protein LptC|nr:LPS export ABC transporter periplasmic protein LptC [Alphaproteobacteria bacterium]NCC03409.1 LPS export ABC transporter periplasmic protein LptC [Pseudomonadota bacterium]